MLLLVEENYICLMPHKIVDAIKAANLKTSNSAQYECLAVYRSLPGVAVGVIEEELS